MSDTTFDACQHGNNFAKTTTLKGTSGIFEHLGGHCDGSNAHANWKVQRLGPQWIFNTAAEAEYPRLLAERMVAAVMTKLPQHLFQQTILRFRLDLLQQADKQHKLGEQLIPEYCKVSFRDEPPLTGSFKLLAQPFNQTGEDNDKGCAAKGSHESNRYKIGFHFSWRCETWHLLVHKFGFLTSVFYDDYPVSSVFYDDYPVCEVQPLAALTSKIVDAFLNVLGWRHAVQGKKAVDFCSQPVALGVQFNLEHIWTGDLLVQNQPGRIDRIAEMIALVKEAEGKSKALVASLAGLMNFAGGFVLGHHFRLGSHALNAWAHHHHVSQADVRLVCDYLLAVAKAVQPKRIHLHDSNLPWIVYTDGAMKMAKALGALWLTAL